MLWWWTGTLPSCGFRYNSKAEPRCSRLPAKSNEECCACGIFPRFCRNELVTFAPASTRFRTHLHRAVRGACIDHRRRRRHHYLRMVHCHWSRRSCDRLRMAIAADDCRRDCCRWWHCRCTDCLDDCTHWSVVHGVQVDWQVAPAAFGGDSVTVWMDNKNHCGAFGATIHPSESKQKRHN